MENVNIKNVIDELENKLKLERVAKRLIEFKYNSIVNWINRMDRKVFSDRQEYGDKTDKDIDDCAKEIMEVVNGSKS